MADLNPPPGEPGRAAGRISGQAYGEGAAANELLRAARGASGGAGPGVPSASREAGGAPQGGGGGGQQLPDVFAPTQRPDEPITEGAPGTRDPIIPEDPHFLTRVFATLHPSTELLGMLDDG